MSLTQPEQFEVNGKKLDKNSFREGFVTGWFESVGNKEPDKQKLREIAKAAAENYLNSRK